MPREDSGQAPGFWKARTLPILITVAALLFAIIHIILPRLKIDGVLLGLLALSLIPWLGNIFESIELPGGYKFNYRQLQKAINEAKGAASSAQEEAQLAKGAASSAQSRAELAIVSSEVGPTIQTDAFRGGWSSAVVDEMWDSRRIGEPMADLTPEAKQDELRRLFGGLRSQYNHTREWSRPGEARTAAMTKIVRDMIVLARDLEEYDWQKALSSSDGGERLSGYVYLYTNPDESALTPLVQTLVATEDTPFGQYWAIQALRPVLSVSDDSSAKTVEQPLRTFLTQLQPGTDRHYELSRLLQELELSPGSRQPAAGGSLER